MHKKAAFTMVELIFVIVILGILAAVAVPRLNASRADAKTAALKANLVTLAKDFETYYAANGGFCAANSCYAYLTKITNVQFDEMNTSKTEGYFTIDGEKCVYIRALVENGGKNKWMIATGDYSGCKEEFQKDAYNDIEWIFKGYSAGLDRDINARETTGRYLSHYLNDPSKGVNFE